MTLGHETAGCVHALVGSAICSGPVGRGAGRVYGAGAKLRALLGRRGELPSARRHRRRRPRCRRRHGRILSAWFPPPPPGVSYPLVLDPVTAGGPHRRWADLPYRPRSGRSWPELTLRRDDRADRRRRAWPTCGPDRAGHHRYSIASIVNRGVELARQVAHHIAGIGIDHRRPGDELTGGGADRLIDSVGAGPPSLDSHRVCNQGRRDDRRCTLAVPVSFFSQPYEVSIATIYQHPPELVGCSAARAATSASNRSTHCWTTATGAYRDLHAGRVHGRAVVVPLTGLRGRNRPDYQVKLDVESSVDRLSRWTPRRRRTNGRNAEGAGHVGCARAGPQAGEPWNYGQVAGPTGTRSSAGPEWPSVFGPRRRTPVTPRSPALFGHRGRRSATCSRCRRRDLIVLLDDRAAGWSGPGLFTTRAERDGDHWVINGEKNLRTRATPSSSSRWR